MYNTALRILNDTAEAEDVMQEAFLDAFRKIDSYRQEASFGSWLKRIVINRSLDVVKKSKDMASIEDLGGELAEDEPQEDYIELLAKRVDDIRRCIHMLPDNDRVVLSLYLLEGYDHEEISQILNVTNNVSRTRYSRARSRLLEYLKNDTTNSLSKNA